MLTRLPLLEPELFGGYDPKKKGLIQEVEIQHDLEPIEASPEDADRFKREHGDKVDIYTDDGSKWFVKFKKGAKIMIPKSIQFDRLVAGQSKCIVVIRASARQADPPINSSHRLVAQGFRHSRRHRGSGRPHLALGSRVRFRGAHDGRYHRPV